MAIKPQTTVMDPIYVPGKTFENTDFTQSPLAVGEYERCTFARCNFSAAVLSDSRFLDCEFNGCNLSLANLTKTGFRNVKFRNNKMLGLRFENCSEFGLLFSFENCILNHCSFYRTKLKKTSFKNSQIHEADFTECDLTGAVFDNCDLSRATFVNTIIEKADFRTSFNYSIDPEINRIAKAKFSLNGVVGLLDKYDIEIAGMI